MKIIFVMRVVILAMSLVGLTSGALSEQPRAFDAGRLRNVHDHLLADYPVERKKYSSTFTNLDGFYQRLVTALEAAGVKELVDGPKTGLVSPTIRIAILNDYGFWLNRTRDPRKAIPILQKVLELAPTRAVAELNLGDAARSSLTVAETWAEKGKFITMASQAYAAYQRLAGKEAPAAHEFQALHATPSVNESVCSYVAAFYNFGRQPEMWGYPDPVDIAGDGKLRHVYLLDEGTAHVPVIFASTKAIPDEVRSLEAYKEPPEVDFSLTKDQSGVDDSSAWHDELHVLPFKEGYYVVYQDDDGPVAVVKPNAGTACQFKRNFTPVLAENRAPVICARASAGSKFDKLPRKKAPDPIVSVIASEELGLSGIDNSHADFEAYSDVKLDPLGAPARLGYFDVDSGAGRGCGESGIAFLGGQGLEKSSRSRAWIEKQAQMLKCHGATAFPVQVNGEFLIEVDDGDAIQRAQPPRSLLRLRGDQFDIVCRVEQRPTYISEPVVKSH
jgi:hypothetical protein